MPGFRLLLLWVSLSLSALAACTRPAPVPARTELAFYHWQTTLDLNATEQAWLDTLAVRRLYVKFFDVDWDDSRRQPTPQAVLQRGVTPPGADIVPTIFLTNRTFQQLPAAEIPQLASRIATKIAELWPGLQPTEIQLDCDWTATTRAAYFSFLQQLRTVLPAATRLSATIRLHQYRYPHQTGVPPVDRGMLMCYNMGDLADPAETNSILNLARTRPYLATTTTYPLPLDLALPLFRWGVLFREGSMIKLINGLTATDLPPPAFAPCTDTTTTCFRARTPTYLQGYYLYQGDEIRLEAVPPATLHAAAQLLRQVPPGGRRYLSFYHLDSAMLAPFTYPDVATCLKLLEP